MEHTIQNDTRKEAELGLARLLEYLDTTLQEFHGRRIHGRPVRTMRDPVIPAHITHIAIGDEVYEIGTNRGLWFERASSGYDERRFFIAEAIDEQHKLRQLSLRRENGTVTLVRSRMLGTVSMMGSRSLGTRPYLGD